jgi:hypothetical protein
MAPALFSVVAAMFHVNPEDITNTGKRGQDELDARAVIALVLRRGGESYANIGRVLGYSLSTHDGGCHQAGKRLCERALARPALLHRAERIVGDA